MEKINKIFTCFISCYSHAQRLHTRFSCSSTRAQHEVFQTSKHVQDYKQEHWHHSDLTCLPLSLICSVTGTAHWNCSPKNSFSSKPFLIFSPLLIPHFYKPSSVLFPWIIHKARESTHHKAAYKARPENSQHWLTEVKTALAFTNESKLKSWSDRKQGNFKKTCNCFDWSSSTKRQRPLPERHARQESLIRCNNR